MSIRRDTVAAPYVVDATGRFDGDDGKWSTFAISIGTPPQSVRVLPGTVSLQVTVPTEEGCTGQAFASVSSTCGDLRGIDNNTRNGFIRSDSGTWSLNGPAAVLSQQTVIQDVGLFGTDTVQLGRSGDTTHNASFADQVVAGISQTSFLLGGLGLSTAPLNISGISKPSLLTTMKNQSVIPSLSYGYTAGQYYNSQRQGKLVLGGYDKAQIADNVVSQAIDFSGTFPKLQLDVQGIVSQNAAGGSSKGFLANPITVSIDTSVGQMWLPSEACDRIADAFGLAEDKSTGYFIMNQTAHDSLKSSNPTLTFTIGGSRAGATTNIVMKYNSLDLSVGFPIYSASVPYFPIRRAANDSQLIFGRAFLQEAYLLVDWERKNFTVGPVTRSDQSTIVAVQPPSSISSSSPSTSASTSSIADSGASSGLSTGAIVGIIIPIILMIAAACGLLFFLRRRRERRRQMKLRESIETQPPEYDPTGGSYYETKHNSMAKSPQHEISELFDSSKPRAELTSDNVRRLEQMAEQRELMSTPILELEGDRADSELDGGSAKGDRTSGLSGVVSPLRQSVTSPPPERVTSPLSRHSVYEME